jgi:serine/threonine protein kinase
MPVVGEVLGERYRIEGVLGGGGMASVYRATDLRLEREVAVKVLLPNLARDPSLATRFDREARMLAAVAHPAVAAVYDVELGDPKSGREPFFVMELCDGGSLADRIDTHGPLDPGEVVPTITSVAQGLAELHRRGLIHRDVKPGNILFAGGRPKLADFGLARADASSEETTLTAPGTTVGTLGYLAPELIGGGQPSVASDTYGLGATAFHAFTGRPPRSGDSLADLEAARSTARPSVSSVMPRIGPAFDGPCAAALALDPAARPGPQRFAAELNDALVRWLDEASEPSGDALVTTVSTRLVPELTEAEPPAERVMAERGDSGVATGTDPTTRVFALLGLLALALGVVVLAVVTGQGSIAPGASNVGPDSSPTSTPSPSPSPGATVDAAAPALRALDAVVAAIEQARGGKDGLGGGDAKDLQALAEDARRALEAGDFSAARVAADRLAERADDVSGDLDETRREALLGAIDALREAIPAG